MGLLEPIRSRKLDELIATAQRMQQEKKNQQQSSGSQGQQQQQQGTAAQRARQAAIQPESTDWRGPVVVVSALGGATDRLLGVAAEAAIAIQNARLAKEIEREAETRSQLSRLISPERFTPLR